MTGYDPYAYGQVRLGGAAGQPQGQPDDILFAEQTSGAKAATADDSDWALLDADVGSLLPGGRAPSNGAGIEQFAADVLGEAPGVPQPAAAAPAPSSPRRPASARPRAPAVSPAPLPPPLPRPKERMAATARPAAFDLQPQGSAAALLMPMLVFAAGGAGGAWLATIGQNPVLGGIAAAAAAVAALFCRVLMRR